ncbi:MAG TPA: ATP-binding protein [Methylomirabilota bacterium]|nr:ATP-binding protein [Methylomirabilota bacterium]
MGITRGCISVLGFEDCVIYLLDEERGVLVQRAAFGPKNPKDREIFAPLEIKLGQGIVGSVALSKTPEIVPDTRQDPRYLLDDCPRLSEITVPILAEGRLLGIIDSEHSTAGFFNEEHLAILTSIASLCANKLVRARAELQLRALNEDLERRIEARTAELRASNQQLRESEEKFGKAFRASPIILSIAKLANGEFVEVNETFLEALGLERKDVIGKTAQQIGIWRDAESRDAFTRELLAKGHIRNREFVVHRQGKPRQLTLSAELIEIGNEPCIVSVSADITERHEAERELLKTLARERELSQLKSRFVATISHEFRTPLGVILSSADILDRYWHRLQEAARREHLGSIRESAIEMARQMENVLVFGRSEANRLEFTPSPLRLRELCLKVVEQISTASETGRVIEIRTPSEFPILMGDEALLSHILTNLLSNAVKYSPSGSKVECECRIEEPSVILAVRDRGMGIPDQDKENLFSPFYRGSNVGRVPGTGMGLAIVKRCAELHGGEISVWSKQGEGTLVSVRFPFIPATAPEPIISF